MEERRCRRGFQALIYRPLFSVLVLVLVLSLLLLLPVPACTHALTQEIDPCFALVCFAQIKMEVNEQNRSPHTDLCLLYPPRPRSVSIPMSFQSGRQAFGIAISVIKQNACMHRRRRRKGRRRRSV